MATPYGYAHASAVTITTGATALTTSYTVEIALSASTTPTAAAVYGACLAFTSTAPDGSTIDSANYPAGYPTDLTVWYNGSQIAAEVRTCNSTVAYIRFRLQAAISASSSDSGYTLAWGTTTPTTPSSYYNLTTVYLWGDNFNGSGITTGTTAGTYANARSGDSTVSVASNVLSIQSTNASANRAINLGIYVPGATAGVLNPYDVEVECATGNAESSWAQNGDALGLTIGPNGDSAYGLLWSRDTSANPSGTAYFRQTAIAIGSPYPGLSQLPANTWSAMRLRVLSSTSQGGSIWTPGSVRPALVANTATSGYNSATGTYAGLLSRVVPNTNYPTLHRYFRVRQAVANDPTVTTAADQGAFVATPVYPLGAPDGAIIVGSNPYRYVA